MSSEHIHYSQKWGSKIQKLFPVPRLIQFDVCLYHAGCPDGIAGAFPFWKNMKLTNNNEMVFYGGKHNEQCPKDIFTGKNVVIVDFSYPRDIMIDICKHANVVVVLDHHDTAFRFLKGLDEECENFGYIFDMLRSGAQISWEWVCPDIKVPWFIDIIADRDLWKWEIPKSKEIGKALYHFGWYNWDKMDILFNYNGSEDEMISGFSSQGTILVEIENKDVSYAISSSILCDFEGFRVRLTTCQPTIRSEVGNSIANLGDCEFSVIWRYDPPSDQWWISLRGSKKCNIDINHIVEKFGGGGHPKACGFTIHGSNSKDWKNSSSKRRMNMAHGNLWSYFKILEA